MCRPRPGPSDHWPRGRRPGLVLDAVHRVPPEFAIGDHLAELGADLAVLDDADRFRDHRGDGRDQLHARVRAAEIGPAEEVEVHAAAAGAEHLHHRRRIVEHEQPVPRDQHAVEEQHAILLVEHLQRVAPRTEPARHRLARQNLQSRRVDRDRERQHASRIVAHARTSPTARRSIRWRGGAAVESCLPPVTMTPSLVSSTTCSATCSSSGTSRCSFCGCCCGRPADRRARGSGRCRSAGSSL